MYFLIKAQGGKRYPSSGGGMPVLPPNQAPGRQLMEALHTTPSEFDLPLASNSDWIKKKKTLGGSIFLPSLWRARLVVRLQTQSWRIKRHRRQPHVTTTTCEHVHDRYCIKARVAATEHVSARKAEASRRREISRRVELPDRNSGAQPQSAAAVRCRSRQVRLYERCRYVCDA